MFLLQSLQVVLLFSSFNLYAPLSNQRYYLCPAFIYVKRQIRTKYKRIKLKFDAKHWSIVDNWMILLLIMLQVFHISGKDWFLFCVAVGGIILRCPNGILPPFISYPIFLWAMIFNRSIQQCYVKREWLPLMLTVDI